MPSFYDTHAHLSYPDFADELPEIIERARVAGITKIVGIANDIESGRRALAIAERFTNVFAVVCWDPSDAAEASEGIRAGMGLVAKDQKAVDLCGNCLQ